MLNRRVTLKDFNPVAKRRKIARVIEEFEYSGQKWLVLAWEFNTDFPVCYRAAAVEDVVV